MSSLKSWLERFGDGNVEYGNRTAGGHSDGTSRTLAATEFTASEGDGGESCEDCEGKTEDGIVGVLSGALSESVLSCSEKDSRRISTHQRCSTSQQGHYS